MCVCVDVCVNMFCVNVCVILCVFAQVLIMMHLVDSLDSKARVTVLHSFYALFKELTALERTVPSLFPEVCLYILFLWNWEGECV